MRECCEKGCKEPARKFSRCWQHYNAWSAKGAKKYAKKAVKKPVKKRSVKHNKSRKDYKEVIIALGNKWETEGTNICWECGKYVKLLDFVDNELQPNYYAFAHIVGRGECGGKDEVVNDPENLACMCGEDHNKMDQSTGVEKAGERWSNMKCRQRLLKRWNYIKKKHEII